MDIQIFRDYQIIDGYVRVPPNGPKDRVLVNEALSLFPGSYVVQLTNGSGPDTGSRHGVQRFLRMER